MRQFTAEEIEQLGMYISNPAGDIFIVRNLPGLVGPTFVRYSRAPGGYREILLDEFLKEGVLDAEKAQDLIARVLIAFGDESVGELEGAHLSMENVSNLAAKIIEDRRIGGSPIEQSSRYVLYDQLNNEGNYRYYRDPSIMASRHGEAFVQGMDSVFAAYTSLVEPMMGFFSSMKPLEEAAYAIKPNDSAKYRLEQLVDEKNIKAFRRTYSFDIKSKACDTIRCLLPAATQTNVGIFGNGRFFQHMLTHLYSSDLQEMSDIAARAHAELNEQIPVFVKRARRSNFLVETEHCMRELALILFGNTTPDNGERVSLLENAGQEGYTDHLIAQMLFKYTNLSLHYLRYRVRGFSGETKQDILRTYTGERQSRFDRSGRACEFGYPFTFNLRGDFGMYRDLHRHRMLTQERQMLTTKLGFDIPQELVNAGFEEKIQECISTSKSLWEKIANDLSPEAAQYAVLFGFNIQWTMGMNLREAQHMLELRTGPQGHPNYRKMCLEMNNLILKRFPELAGAMQFVDHDEYFWSRAESEARQRQKESALENRMRGQP